MLEWLLLYKFSGRRHIPKKTHFSKNVNIVHFDFFECNTIEREVAKTYLHFYNSLIKIIFLWPFESEAIQSTGNEPKLT